MLTLCSSPCRQRACSLQCHTRSAPCTVEKARSSSHTPPPETASPTTMYYTLALISCIHVHVYTQCIVQVAQSMVALFPYLNMVYGLFLQYLPLCHHSSSSREAGCGRDLHIARSLHSLLPRLLGLKKAL